MSASLSRIYSSGCYIVPPADIFDLARQRELQCGRVQYFQRSCFNWEVRRRLTRLPQSVGRTGRQRDTVVGQESSRKNPANYLLL